MKKELQEIKPKEGLGNIRFGMTREEVREILGDPEEIDSYSFSGDDEDISESWHYDELSLSMAFDETEDWRLTTLAVSNPFYQLDGRSLIGINRSQLEEQLEELGIKDLEKEEWMPESDSPHHLLSSESTFLNFWLDGEILNEIQWSPAYDEDDALVWPE